MKDKRHGQKKKKEKEKTWMGISRGRGAKIKTVGSYCCGPLDIYTYEKVKNTKLKKLKLKKINKEEERLQREAGNLFALFIRKVLDL